MATAVHESPIARLHRVSTHGVVTAVAGSTVRGIAMTALGLNTGTRCSLNKDLAQQQQQQQLHAPLLRPASLDPVKPDACALLPPSGPPLAPPSPVVVCGEGQ